MNQKHVEQIFDEYRMIAIIIYAEHHSDGIDFFTPPNLSQQLASMKRPKGYKIPAHIHKPVPREVKYTQETLFIKKGRVDIKFYDEKRNTLRVELSRPAM
jgi:hypothetical protein